MDENIHSSLDWPPEFQELQKIDELLRCGICYEYLNISMMTTCSHNYCSVCIRKYMSYKSACPTCFVITSEPELKTNRVLDQLVQSFASIRSKLLHVLKNYVPVNPESSHKRKAEMDAPDTKKQRKEEDSDASSIEPDNQSLQMLNSDILENEKVECPVCAVKIPSRNIDRHVDACLNKSQNIPKNKEEGNKLKPLPKLVYHLMSDRDLKCKLKQHGLNTQGDRPILIKRHHSFTILYNANCDSLKPKPIPALVRQVEKEERAAAPKIEKINFSNRREDPVEQEQQFKGYIKEHKNQFDKLIDDIKQRSKQNPTSTQTHNIVTQIKPMVDDISQQSKYETDIETTLDEEDDDCMIPSTPPLVKENSPSHSPLGKFENSPSSSFAQYERSPIITSNYQNDNDDTLEFGQSCSNQEIVSDSNSSDDSISLLQ